MKRNEIKNKARLLAKEAQQLIARRKYEDAVFLCLVEHTHGCSGWIKEVEDMFCSPQDEEEREIKNELLNANFFAGEGLLKSIVCVSGWQDAANVRAAALCLARSKKISPEIREKTNRLIAECEKIGF